MDDATIDRTDPLAGIAEHLMQAHTMGEGSAVACRGLADLLPGTAIGCLLATHHQSALHLCVGRSTSRSTHAAVLRLFHELGGAKLTTTGLHLQQDVRPDIPPGWQTATACVVPVRTHDMLRGLLLAGSKKPEPSRILHDCAARIAPVLLGLDRLFYEARVDPVSGLFNRRFLDETLAREYALAQRHSYPLGLLLLDLDQLKLLNDTYGHPAGDEAIRHLGVALREALRAGDVACRYGGDEFAVILPHADLAAAQRVATRVRRNLGGCRVHAAGKKLGIAVSIGVAAYDPAEATDQTSSLLAQADQALYRAKAEQLAQLDESRIESGSPSVPSSPDD